jgi:5-hydroxytryptamine receptor 7
MIVVTVVGNTLVCLSPIYFRKLRHPSNYLLISLALSDLGVALLVMPVALYSEIQPGWYFGMFMFVFQVNIKLK